MKCWEQNRLKKSLYENKEANKDRIKSTMENGQKI